MGVAIAPSAGPSMLGSITPFQRCLPGASNGNLVSVYIVYHVENHGLPVFDIFFADFNDTQYTIEKCFSLCQQNQKVKV